MFCDRCGAQLSGTEAFCGSCGKALRAVPPPRPLARGRVESHLRTLAICWMAYSGLRLLGGFFVTGFTSFFFGGFGSYWNPHVPFFVPGLIRTLGGLLMASGILGVIAGWGLLERQSWARILAIVLGIFTLVHFPIGTALGIFTLWVLMPQESAREYERTARTV